MAIKSTRVSDAVNITIKHDICIHCGLCATVCPGVITNENGNISVNRTALFGCIACAQCMAICPVDCITVEGRGLSCKDMTDMPVVEQCADYDSLFNLMFKRRSIRKFIDKPVEKEVVSKIINAATTAPMGIPPTEVSALVLNGKAKVREFVDEYIQSLRKNKFMFSAFGSALLKMMMSKTSAEVFDSFVIPLYKALLDAHEKGSDDLFYDAPLAILFYGTEISDPADSYIAATYAMLAGEAMGLGTCFIGTVYPMLKYMKPLRAKYNLPSSPASGIAVLFGYPAIKFRKSVRRTLNRVDNIE